MTVQTITCKDCGFHAECLTEYRAISIGSIHQTSTKHVVKFGTAVVNADQFLDALETES